MHLINSSRGYKFRDTSLSGRAAFITIGALIGYVGRETYTEIVELLSDAIVIPIVVVVIGFAVHVACGLLGEKSRGVIIPLVLSSIMWVVGVVLVFFVSAISCAGFFERSTFGIIQKDAVL